MLNNIRTDLAIEAHEMLMETAGEISGVSFLERDEEGLHIARVKIETEEAAKAMGKPVGNYVTVEFRDLSIVDGADYETLCHTVARELEALLGLSSDSKVLVVGLGNRHITPDALGPMVTQKLVVTRHLFTHMPQVVEGLRSVCALAPGVLGTTGMETMEVVRGVAEKVSPDALIVIDALAARSIDRISTTVQLCDTGLAPGAGVGNNRKSLNRESLGIPVVAVGVPMVVDATTITADSLSLLAESEEESDLKERVKDFSPEDRYRMLRSALPESLNNFIVTPKEVDLLLERLSGVVANGINLALHEDLSLTDIAAFLA